MIPVRLPLATLLAIGLLGAPCLLLVVGQLSPVAARLVLVSFMGGTPLLFVYLWVLWLLRNGQPRQAAAALALGALSALAFSLPALLPAFLRSRSCTDYRDGGWALALVPIGRSAVVAAALHARRSVAGANGIPRWTLLGPVAFLFAAIVAVPSRPVGLHDRLDRNDSSALFSISRIRDCARDYAARNPTAGYPPSLASCGADGAPARAETAGHLIRYEAAAPDAGGRINRYRASAQPREWGCSSWTSYWSDESGVLHSEFAKQPGTELGGRQEP